MGLPVTVIGGYLGAGKTTLVNHLLRQAQGLRMAVLVNDFGEINIDADLIEAQSDQLISLAGGCVCCSFGENLVGALQQFAERPAAFDHLIVEASGVALPAAVAQCVQWVPRCELDGIVVLADAETVRRRAADAYVGDTVTRQLQSADLLVLNKTDLIAARALGSLHAWLAQQAPRARVVDAVGAAIPPAVVLGAGWVRTGPVGAGPALFPRSTDAARADEGGRLRPRSAAHAAAQLFEAHSFRVEPRLDVQALARALTEPRLGLLRAKGMLQDRDGTRKTVHIVGERWHVAAAPSAGAAGAPDGRLVCIGLKGRVDVAAIEALVSASE